MGAGARLAEERDRWPDHWRVADLDQEGELLLDLLAPAEELRAAVPGLRTNQPLGEGPVLIGVTDRRVLVVGRWRAAEPVVSVDDATRVMAEMAAGGMFPGVLTDLPGGTVELDLDAMALARLWAQMGGLGSVAGVG